MKKLVLIFAAIIFTVYQCNAYVGTDDIISLNYKNDETPTYYEIIEMYSKLGDAFKEAKLLEYGITDAGKPLHLFVISKDKDFNPISIRQKGKTVLLINNGIHPGETCGIDASLKFANDILLNKGDLKINLENTVVCIIPVYNVGGSLNRSAFHRTGHTSPKESGFRGNAKNLDLNRDFVKCDTKNAITFTKIFQLWKPEVFLDTHTTNGSEHQYVITLIAPQHNSMHPVHDSFLKEKMLPQLYAKMKAGKYEMIPYVIPYGKSPKDGIISYVQTGKFSSGYAQLFNSLGFMTENHIYKSYSDRVESVYSFIKELLIFTNDNYLEIINNKKKVDDLISKQNNFVINYKLDDSRFDTIEFKGYEAGNYTSPVTGLKRFGYDLTKPFIKDIPYYDYYKPDKTITKPVYYVVPQAWSEVIDRFKLNNIKMERLSKDTALSVEVYYIESFEDERRQNNGHNVHRDIKIRSENQKINYYKGDYIIKVNQPYNRYIVEMLEPLAAESFFAWNFFDPCLESREYFSSYGFEANALKYLNGHPEFKLKFEEKKKNDRKFAKNHRQQLSYIYYNTEWNETSYKRYPVTRINKELKLPL